MLINLKSCGRRGEEVSQNTMRLIRKNIKKKLPPKILRNFQNTGYKLIE